MMKQGIQTFLSEAGEAACYALCIIELAERITGKQFYPIETLIKAIDAKLIHYNWADAKDPDNFFVRSPDMFLSYLTEKKFTVTKEEPSYVLKQGEYSVLRYERKTINQMYNHFRLVDWDSLVDSQTVKLGSIQSQRVFRRA